MAYVEVDAADYLYEVSDEALAREVRRRIGAGRWAAEPWTRAGMAHDLRTAFYARDASRMEMIAAALEEREGQ